MTKLQTSLLGREATPGGDCGYVTIEEVRADARAENRNYTEEEIANWHKYTNEQRERLRKSIWGDAETAEIVNVWIDSEGNPQYTLVTDQGELRNMSQNHIAVAR